MKARICKSRNGTWFVAEHKNSVSRVQFFYTWQEAVDWVVNPSKYYWGVERLERRY